MAPGPKPGVEGDDHSVTDDAPERRTPSTPSGLLLELGTDPFARPRLRRGGCPTRAGRTERARARPRPGVRAHRRPPADRAPRRAARRGGARLGGDRRDGRGGCDRPHRRPQRCVRLHAGAGSRACRPRAPRIARERRFGRPGRQRARRPCARARHGRPHPHPRGRPRPCRRACASHARARGRRVAAHGRVGDGREGIARGRRRSAARGAHLDGLRRHRCDARQRDGRRRRDRCAAPSRARSRELVDEAEPPPTPLQARLGGLARWMVVLGVGVTVVLGAAMLARGESLRDAFLVGVSVAVAAVPEGLAATVTIALALGSREMARRGAIVRTFSAIETIGEATVICTDKTGTLTENRLRLERHEPAAGRGSDDLLWAAAAASAAEVDPVDRALLAACAERVPVGEIETLHSLPFEASRKRATVVVRHGEHGRLRRQGGPGGGSRPLRRRPGRARAAAASSRSEWAAEGSPRAGSRLTERRSRRDLRGGARVEPAAARPRRSHRSTAPHGSRLAPRRA